MPNQVYICDFCKKQAENIADIKHTPTCQFPRLQLLMEDLASLHGEVTRLRAENEKLRGEAVGLEYMLEKAQERLGEI